jgi:hypothetical protein
MIRASVLWLAIFVLGVSCTQKMICPAYQSSFIYDKESLRKKFSYFKEDSTPKNLYTASKSKYLVAVPESYRKKTRSLQTVEMTPIFPVIPDSLKLNKGERELMGDVDVVDSTAAPVSDSAYAITKTKEKYNVDQDIYMWYFRDMLVLPDVRAAMETKSESQAASAKSKKKKGLFSFLKRKPKTADSLATEEVVPTDSTTTSPKKKGLLGIFGKKDKSKTVAPSKKKDPAKKEGEDDGF